MGTTNRHYPERRGLSTTASRMGYSPHSSGSESKGSGQSSQNQGGGIGNILGFAAIASIPLGIGLAMKFSMRAVGDAGHVKKAAPDKKDKPKKKAVKEE